MDIYTLNVFDVQKQQDAKFSLEMAGYKKILEQIFIRIRQITDTGDTHLIYQIPPFIFGLPPINIPQCKVFLETNLKAHGFHVKLYSPNIILVQWPRTIPNAEQYVVSKHRSLNPGIGLRPGSNFKPLPAPMPQYQYQSFNPLPQLPPPIVYPTTTTVTKRKNKTLDEPKYDSTHQEKYFEAINNIIPKKNVRFKQ